MVSHSTHEITYILRADPGREMVNVWFNLRDHILSEGGSKPRDGQDTLSPSIHEITYRLRKDQGREMISM